MMLLNSVERTLVVIKIIQKWFFVASIKGLPCTEATVQVPIWKQQLAITGTCWIDGEVLVVFLSWNCTYIIYILFYRLDFFTVFYCTSMLKNNLIVQKYKFLSYLILTWQLFLSFKNKSSNMPPSWITQIFPMGLSNLSEYALISNYWINNTIHLLKKILSNRIKEKRRHLKAWHQFQNAAASRDKTTAIQRCYSDKLGLSISMEQSWWKFDPYFYV